MGKKGPKRWGDTIMDRSNNTNKNLKDQHVPGNVKYTKLSYNSMYSNFNVLGLYTKKTKRMSSRTL